MKGNRFQGNRFRTPKRSRSDLWAEALAAVFVFSVSLASVCLFLHTLDRLAARVESRNGGDAHQTVHASQPEVSP